MLIRHRRSIVGLLVSTASTSLAAWLPAVPIADRTLRRASSRSALRGSGGLDFEPPAGLQAVCDRRSQTCRLHQGAPARTGEPVMQQIACDDAPSGAPADEEMAKQYNPAEVEERLYEWWESSGYFQPSESEDKQCFVISMPPPNVTGKLHMGHAMFVALEDIMARFARMRGHPTLWLPGTDHAGIATQMLVERALKAEGIERTELGREAFLERVWEWKAEYGGYITGQIRRLGASCDWLARQPRRPDPTGSPSQPTFPPTSRPIPGPCRPGHQVAREVYLGAGALHRCDRGVRASAREGSDLQGRVHGQL
jgi:hypothetical protein